MSINKYMSINQDILLEVDSFAKEHFEGKNTVGLHFRGTDKKQESFQISYDEVLEKLMLVLSSDRLLETIFVSSDESKFIDFIKDHIKSHTIICRADSIRSTNELPFHNDDASSKFDMNKDAIINCLLLSRCNTLVKSVSLLSDWSKLFSPELPVVMLNEPFNHLNWFPTSAVIKSSIKIYGQSTNADAI